MDAVFSSADKRIQLWHVGAAYCCSPFTQLSHYQRGGERHSMCKRVTCSDSNGPEDIAKASGKQDFTFNDLYWLILT